MKSILKNTLVILSVSGHVANAQNIEIVNVQPEIFEYALNNPLKGFRPGLSTAKRGNHPYAKVVREYIKWSELERNEEDGIQRIIEVCNQKWSGAGDLNVKIIPRVYLDWDSDQGNEYWPSDMETWDYSSYEFEQRVTRLVKRLGKVWDEDPRIAWVQMGIIGYWGEHHHPSPSVRQQELFGELLTDAFKHKKVLVRHPFSEFRDYPFGWYWDSFAHWDQIGSQAVPMLNNCPDRWKTAPVEGETAYNWGNYQIQPGDNPNVTLKDPAHRDWLIRYIRTLHCTALGWVSNFDVYNAEVLAGAEEVQRAFGYRYNLKEVSYPVRIGSDEPFTVTFSVENTGSAPFYYHWPVELRLLDPETHQTKWRQVFNEVDIRTWMPGDDWQNGLKIYGIEPEVYVNSDTFQLEGSLEKGKYILALAILDPAGMVPAIKFATRHYFNGGIHPIGYVGLDTLVGEPGLEGIDFDDPAQDNTLYYSEERDEIIDDVPSEIFIKPTRKPMNNEHWRFPGDSVIAWQFDYFDDGTGAYRFALDTAQTVGLYGCNEPSGFNIRSYTDSIQIEDAAQLNWNNKAQTFEQNGQWCEYSALFDLELPYQLLVRARNDVEARFRFTILSTGRDTIYFKDMSLREDFENQGGGNEQSDWFICNELIENLWGACIIRFDWYDNIGDPGIFGAFSFSEVNLDLTPPEWYYASVGTIPAGTDIVVMTNEAAKVFLVPSGTPSDAAQIKDAALGSIEVSAYEQGKFSTYGLAAGEYVVFAMDISGNISVASPLIRLETTLLRSDISADLNIRMNYFPAAKLIDIQSSTGLHQLIVYDLSGKRIDSRKIDGRSYTLNVAGYVPGLYLFQVFEKNGNIATTKVYLN